MNRVYKVIWSKAKHCYVVTSEIARSVTKSASSARSAGRKGAAVLAMAALLFTAGGVLGEAATANVTDVSGSSEARNLIIVTKDDGTSTNFSIDNVAHATEAVHATAADRATRDGNGVIIDTNYVKNADAEVDAGGTYVKVANTVGKNLSALDTNLSALDTNLSALDEQVKKNTEAVVKVGQTAGENFTDLYAKVQTNADAVTAEETARKTADQNNLKIEGDDGVISKVSNDGTTSTAVNKLVLKVDGDNQITMDKYGIKVGTNSGVMDKDGFYAGGDDYEHAGAALKWDGSIKGAAGDFTVDTKGKVTAASGKIGTVEITSAGAVSGVTDLTVNGTFDSKTLSSTVDAKDDYTTINGGNVTSEVNDKVGTVDYSAESIFNKDGSSITVRTDEGIVDSTGKSIVGAKEISQYLGDNAKPEGSQKNVTRKMIRNNDGTFSMEDKAVDGTNKYSTVSQNAGERKVTVIDGNNKASTNLSNNGFNTFASDGTNKTYTKQTATDIKNTAEKGMISHTAKNLVNRAYENMTNTVDNDLTTTVGGNETRTVKGTLKETVTGNVTEDYKANLDTKVGGNETHYVAINQTNTVSGDRTVNVKGTEKENFNAQVTNVKTDQKTSVGGKQTNIVGGDQQNTVSGSKTETVKGAVTEKYGSQATTVDKDLTTTVGGNETHAVTGNQTVTVSKDRTVNVKGTETENFNAQVTNVKTDQKTSVGGNQTNIVTGNQQNTVSGSKTETVNKAVTEKYGSQATTVNGDQSTNVGGNQSNVVKGNQTNTISGNKTETVKGEVTEKYGSLTTEVKGESKLSAANITNSAKEKLSNSAVEIENSASTSIIDKVGDNVERTMTTDQIQDKVGKTTVTTIDGKTTLTDEDHNHTTEMDYANVTKDLSVYRNTTLGQEGEDTNLTVNSKSTFKDTVKMEKTLDVDGNTTLGKEGKDTTLTVNSKSTFKDTVKMENTLAVDGESTFNNKVTITKGGLDVTGDTTTDTLHVNGGGYVGGDLNVAGNIETHDAVLSADSRQVVTGRQLYQTNERVDRLDNRIKKVGANAAALAALRPGDFNPDDKFSIAAGFGSYRNANAAALGLFYRPNENVLLSLGTSFGDGENMVNAGVSVKFGRGKSMAERRKEMADEVSSMRDEMRSQDERIAELEEMLKKQSELIEKLSKES